MARIKRIYIEEAERVAENIYNQFGRQIKDEQTFNKIINEYIGEPESKKQKEFFQQVFQTIADRHPRTIQKTNLFKKAKGKDWKKDKEKTAKTIVNTPQEYIKKGAKNVDLKGYDMPTVGRIKNKIVKVKLTHVIIKGKRQIRYRDSKGRFAKVKR